MDDRYLICLAAMLREEEGDDQPVGGPYKRGRWAYSDDPDDSGGKTEMGVLQREYDAWRRNQGLPTQWVKNITDAELTTIYHDQYWVPICAGQLPPGVDLITFDMAVNAGVGKSAQKLQLSLGETPDGHIGQVTLDAVKRADPVKLIQDFTAQRVAYYKACKTYWKFGKDWLERSDRIQTKAIGMARNQAPPPQVSDAAVAAATIEEPKAPRERPDKALTDPPAPPRATELALGGGGLTGVPMAASNAFAKASAAGAFSLKSLALAFASDPLFWVGMLALWGAAATYLYRTRHAQ